MEVRVLRYFIEVVQERNISNAAKRLHISQPTLSRQLMDLEKELGITLLNEDTGKSNLPKKATIYMNGRKRLLVSLTKLKQTCNRKRSLAGH